MYITVAPVVPVVIVTVQVFAYTPAAGVMTGTCGVTVNIPVETLLSGRTPFDAYAFTVSIVDAVIGALNIVDEVVGVLPSVVYLIVAPPVLVIVTVTESVKVPATGENAGAATCAVKAAVDTSLGACVPKYAMAFTVVADEIVNGVE